MKLLKEFAMSLQNNEEILFTNGLFWYVFKREDDEIKLYSYTSDLCNEVLDSLTWDYNREIIPCLYDAYIELVNGYNSVLTDNMIDRYGSLIEPLKMDYVA